MKLRALVVEHLGLDPDGARAGSIEPAAFPSGAAFRLDGRAWILVDGVADRSLGAAIGWAVRNGADELDLVADQDTGLLARRAASFSMPVRVWFAQERTLLAAVAEPLPEPTDASGDHLSLVPLIEAGGATPNVEHGVVTGEVDGLEVCRVVSEPTLGRLTDEHGTPLAAGIDEVAADGEGGVILEVGVGANDREAFQLLHGHVPKADALADVVRAVRRHRSPDAPGHPLNRMAPERALRSHAAAGPAAIGLVSLTPLPPPVPRPSMKDVAPCLAIGTTGDGDDRLVVFSSGVDLELAPFVADAIDMLRRDRGDAPPVVVVLPRRDLLPITASLLDLLDHPVSVGHPDAA